jgi:hypothetical protein
MFDPKASSPYALLIIAWRAFIKRVYNNDYNMKNDAVGAKVFATYFMGGTLAGRMYLVL